MVKWKNSGKIMLAFLLILGLVGGMINPLQFTAAASEKEAGEIPGTGDGMTEEADDRPECVCEILCTVERGETDCSVCKEDVSACGGEDLEELSGEDEKTGMKEEPAEDQPSDAETDAADAPAEEQPSDAETSPAIETDEAETSDSEALPEKESAEDQPSDSEPSSVEETAEELPPDSESVSGEAPAAEESSAEPSAGPEDAAAAVEALIAKLPSLEELKTFDKEAQEAAQKQFQEAFEAYENLTEEQKALLEGAEERLLELLEYFTEPVMPMAATDQQIKGAWDAMTAAMTAWDKTVDLSSYNLTGDDWEKIWPKVADDNPDLFYVMGVNYYTDSAQIIKGCDFTYNSAYNQDSVREYKAAIDNVFAEVIDARMTDEQKATALHDYLVQHMVYDQNANNNLGIEKRNAYEALVNGIGVCQGYTLAYAALLEKAGIESDYCRSQSMNHIWNYVKLDGQWYHADLTYDDATAASQVGETGYVKHTYFLLSDVAMQNMEHKWEPGGITCGSTKYDNSWHKTAPISESAIYAVGGSSYYLKGETVEGAPNTIYRGATLVKRDSGGTETEVASFDIENLGNGWPMFAMSFSRLSCSKGVLYFNVGNAVYAFNPSAGSGVPEKIYQYTDADNRIVTGLLAEGNEMTLEIYNPRTYKVESKITVPLFTLSASASIVEVGYTTAPVLTANPLASGFTWSVKQPDGSWKTIAGEAGSSYTIETGLPEGSYVYRVEATLNGRSVSAQITVMVTDREEQVNFAFAEDAKTVTYGDPDFTLTAQGAAAGSSVSYESSDPSVASVDPTTGLVKILKAGSAVITATASETEDYLEASAEYRLTVSPRALAWDVTALEAADRLDRIGEDRMATLYGELKLSGILEKDLGTVRFVCPADRLTGVYETAAEGSRKVKLSWKNGQDAAVLEGNGSENYVMPSALPEITGKISVANDFPLESVEGTEFKIQVETGVSKVPDAFKVLEHLNTPGKIEKEMKLSLQKKFGGITGANMAVYDVELLINIDGKGWQPVTRDNFPSGGLIVTLPYPAGTGKDSHDFVAAHMFTADMNGFRAGDVEYPAVTKTEKGITFKVYGLSPITIGWEKAESDASKGDNDDSGNNNGGGNGGSHNSDNDNDNGNGSAGNGAGGGSPAGVSAPVAAPASAARTKAASTGDTSPIMSYVILAAAALGGMIGMGIGMKKRRH